MSDLSKRLDEVVGRRTKMETQLEKEQAALRKLDRQRDADAYRDQAAKVNATKAEIGRISAEHVELARAVALASGGTNHAPAA